MIGKLLFNLWKERVSTISIVDTLCSVCGKYLKLDFSPTICDELAKDWNLNNEQINEFNNREGAKCNNCLASLRIINLAKTILEIFNIKYDKTFRNIAEIVDNKMFGDLIVAEISNCGVLHKYLMKLPKLFYSEYASTDSSIKFENLMNLTYENDFFDFVLMSDVLEHVPDYRIALGEINRVLKKGGYFIFTVPYLLDRRNVMRAKILKDNTILNIKKESYHGDYFLRQPDYLVFHEFGWNFLLDLRRRFNISIYSYDTKFEEIFSVIVCKK